MCPTFFLVVAAGGFFGAPSRYLLDRAVTRRVNSDLPWGTFVINVSGSLLLGTLTGLTLSHHLSDLGRALLGTGFCGAYTTFSTFTFETLRLVEDGRYLEAAGNVSVSVMVGLVAATAGLALGLWA
ncbi:MAG TPA: fluoride efflux transporter CrcB [Acidimicrobiales bacterium]|nr:fluoride efflux transporter CrcB [Acidimicrobiales bacterium]